jgi:hypothetical protein
MVTFKQNQITRHGNQKVYEELFSGFGQVGFILTEE